MRVRLTRNVVVRGDHHVAGTVLDLPGPLAVQLINMGKAEPTSDGDMEGDMETAEMPEPERPTPKRKRRKRKNRDG